MVKTLRITSVLAAVLAVGLFAPSMAFGVDSNKEVEKFLSSPGVIEKFNKAKGRKKTAGTSQVSPLVKQAKAFALYLDPPPSPSRSKGARPGTTKTTTRRPPVVSAKFDLVGTSYYQSHPELSLALINQPGKG
ncbi:MAG: hypothetical protein ACYST9_05275, partial [Planctomycetota bacterium]